MLFVKSYSLTSLAIRSYSLAAVTRILLKNNSNSGRHGTEVDGPIHTTLRGDIVMQQRDRQPQEEE